MIIEKYICPGCNKEHERRTYESDSEGVAHIFIDEYFPLIWGKKKDKAEQMAIEEFCKELVFSSIYNYHKNRRRIKIEKSSIEHHDRTENQGN